MNVMDDRREMFLAVLEDMTGETYRIKGLSSDKGKKMNGLNCVVTGYDKDQKGTELGSTEQMRVHVRVNSSQSPFHNETMKLKLQNLIPIEMDNSNDAVLPPPIPFDKIKELLFWAIGEHIQQDYGRQDVINRISFIKDQLPSRKAPGVTSIAKVACMDQMDVEKEADQASNTLHLMKPPCCGDGSVDFAKMNEGLCGTGEDCHICLEPVQAGETKDIIGLPCLHVFHRGCARNWLKEHNNCPTCRVPIPRSGKMYRFDAEHRLKLRFEEWFISGFCQKCMACYLERDGILDEAQGISFS
ncbi:hypothetical protein HDU98_007861 [Podochytrium sp. JEL0797]|nr:hypothetical protein HDU98_007861 [Podochytrium sp. JEL0797]